MAREIEDVKRKDRGRIEDVRLDAHNGAAVKPPGEGGRHTFGGLSREKIFVDRIPAPGYNGYSEIEDGGGAATRKENI